MTEKQRFYVLGHGWATKYYWFNVIEEVTPKTPDFIEMIKKGKFTFSKQSGTTPADVHGSTLALDFFSDKLINILKKKRICNFFAYKIVFVSELKKIGIYHYIEPKKYPVRSFNTKDLEKFHKKNNNSSNLFQINDKTLSAEQTIFDFSNWDGSQLFGVWNATRDEKTTWIIVNQEVKDAIEKARLKNVTFEELMPYKIEEDK